jgi:hypothetical protein
MTDIFFLSFNEANAEQNFKAICTKFDSIKRVSNITGIFNAYKHCALNSASDWFFVVDADTKLIENSDFNFIPPESLNTHNVYVWDAKNPVNGLVYGYGGIKLFHKSRFLEAPKTCIDMTSTVGQLVSINDCISETAFNSSPFDTWKAGFREACKLQRHIMNMPDTPDKKPWRDLASERLTTWMTTQLPEADYGDYCIAGANAGYKYALEHTNILAVNNYYWLKCYFRYLMNE